MEELYHILGAEKWYNMETRNFEDMNMGTFSDFSQLKHLKPAESRSESMRTPPTNAEDRALEGSSNSVDYFSALLGGGEKKAARRDSANPHRTTVVTPATVVRVREELAEDAREAERAVFKTRESELLEELQAQTDACESLAVDLVGVRAELEACRVDCEALEEENRRLAADLATEKARPPQTIQDLSALEERDREIERLKALLAEAQRETRLHDALLDAPTPFSEKFAGEIHEHVVEALADAYAAAEAGGRDRRARILESVLCANPLSGELENRRDAVKQIIKDAGSALDNTAIAELERLGFRYISGNKHHKLEWAGIRFPLAKTPSDYRACLNSAAEIANRVF